MSSIPDVLMPGYFFDLDLMDYRELFDDTSGVWEAVGKMQQGLFTDVVTRALCGNVADFERSRPVVSGSVEVRIARGARIGSNVAVSGSGGLVCVDEDVEILPGTVITTGGNAIYIGRGVLIGPNAYLDASKGGICIGEKAVLRQCAYIREHALIGSGAVIGNSCEIKCSLIGRESEVAHFNYVGDGILGYKAHMGAGAKISNLKIVPDPGKIKTIKVSHESRLYDTGIRKFGAVLGDHVQMGCNSVANPGTMIGRNTLVYAGSSIAGFISSGTVVKLRNVFEQAPLKMEK